MRLDRSILDALEDKPGADGSMMIDFIVPPGDEVETRPNVIFKLLAEKRVIHLGCTDHVSMIDAKIKAGAYLHRQLSYIAAECIGVDINAEAAERARSHGVDNIVVSDITVPGIKEIEEKYWDCILIPEVIEHIPNPAAFLQAIDETYGEYFNQIMLTVPNIYGSFLHGWESFRRENLNIEHCFWFTPYTICKVLHSAGYDIDEVHLCAYENPVNYLRSVEERLKEYPLLQSTIIVTAHSRRKNRA